MEQRPVDLDPAGRTSLRWLLYAVPVVVLVLIVQGSLQRPAREGGGWNSPGEAVGELMLVSFFVAVTALVVGVYVWVREHRMRRVLAHLAVVRPGAIVIRAMSVILVSHADARRAGADTRGVPETSWAPMAIVVLPDRVEAWFGGDRSPRWYVHRAAARAVVVEVPRTIVLRYHNHRPADIIELPPNRLTRTEAVAVVDAYRTLHFVPDRPKAYGVRPTRTAVFAWVLATLGENPADHIVLHDQPGPVHHR